MSAGTHIPTPAEWPALRAAWARGTVTWQDLAGPGLTDGNARMLLSRMVRRGLLERRALGVYAATHARATIIDYVLGEE